MIRRYQRDLSRYFVGACRFTPTCSHYAYGCIAQHGAWTGLRLTAHRLLRCRPGYPSGHDPVPDRDQVSLTLHGRLVEAVDDEGLAGGMTRRESTMP